MNRGTKPSRRARHVASALALQASSTAETMQSVVAGVLEEYHQNFIVGFIQSTRTFAGRLLRRAARREKRTNERLAALEARCARLEGNAAVRVTGGWLWREKED